MRNVYGILAGAGEVIVLAIGAMAMIAAACMSI